jgi:uncharacterized protein
MANAAGGSPLQTRPSAWLALAARRAAWHGLAPSILAMPGYYQLIEGDDGAYMFTLRAGNHDTVVGSRVFWSRHSALDGAATLRVRCQLAEAFVRRAHEDGRHWFEVHDALGNMLARSALYGSRSGLQAGMASVRRNGVSTSFRGLVRHASVVRLAQSLA